MADLKTGALPKPAVTYYRDGGMMYIKNGRAFGEGETIAKDVVFFYDQEDEQEVVGIFFVGGAEVILKPLVDEVLSEHGFGPVEPPFYQGSALVNGYSDPQPIVKYEPKGGYLQVENGRPLGKTAKVADGLVVFFDADRPDEGAGFRLGPDARELLKPLVVAVLEEYGRTESKGVST